MARVDRVVQLAHEADRLDVLAPAVLVGNPAPLRAAVVEVEHRGDGVHPEAVDVALLDPEERVGDEEVADLVAPVVEDVGAPVGVLALPRVGVLVQGRAVEAPKRPHVFREVRGHPVHDDAEAAAVQVIDQVTEIVGRAEARGGRRSSSPPDSPTSR